MLLHFLCYVTAPSRFLQSMSPQNRTVRLPIGGTTASPSPTISPTQRTGVPFEGGHANPVMITVGGCSPVATLCHWVKATEIGSSGSCDVHRLFPQASQRSSLPQR